MQVFKELKRRNVFRVGAAYLLFAWVVVQVSSTVAPILSLPEWTLPFVLWISVIGFPFVLIFAWAFELTPDGIKLEKDVDRSQSVTRSTGQRINHIVIGLLVVAVVFLVVDNYVLTEAEDSAQPAQPGQAVLDVSEGAYDSIGVLPFVNMSDDPGQEYFSDGISEELLNSLAKLKDLQVAARTSSFAYKGTSEDITTIGRQLNVDTVLEGSVRKAGSRLRITAQLIDVGNGYHLWSETYDRELTDIFEVQDEITAAIVEALLVHLDTGADTEATSHAVTSMSAYDAYLQGRHLVRQADNEAMREALTLFRSATEADPEFAAAWAARATSVLALRRTDFRDGIPSEEAFLLARNNIDRALAIDPMLAEAYVAEGLLYSDTYRYEEALASLEKAVEISPNLAEGWVGMSRLLGRFGRIEAAREAMLKALRLDPHNEMTAILAANLADDFYDADFVQRIRPFASQSQRATGIISGLELRGMPLNKALYEQARSRGDATDAALVDFWALKELDEEAIADGIRVRRDFVMWLYIHAGQWERAQAIYDALPAARRQSVLNLEEMSIMQAAQGRCEESLQGLDKAHGGTLRIHGEIGPNVPRSNSNLALNRVYCLRRLGRDDETAPVVESLREYVTTLRENTEYGIFIVDAKLRILLDDVDGALEVLEAADERRELSWVDRYDPVLALLSGEPRYQQLFARQDAVIDALRTELGLPPAEW